MLPLVVFPLLGAILQYGYQYWSLETAAATAREAARALAVGTDPACVTDGRPAQLRRSGHGRGAGHDLARRTPATAGSSPSP